MSGGEGRGGEGRGKRLVNRAEVMGVLAGIFLNLHIFSICTGDTATPYPATTDFKFFSNHATSLFHRAPPSPPFTTEYPGHQKR
jgi:hypothetical protein